MGSNPVGASEFFLGFLCNYLSYFTTAKITFTSILYPAQFTRSLYCNSLFLRIVTARMVGEDVLINFIKLNKKNFPHFSVEITGDPNNNNNNLFSLLLKKKKDYRISRYV